MQGGWIGQGNIDSEPSFVTPGYWADGNDMTITVAPDGANAVWVAGDSRLLPLSPGIDSGDNALVLSDTIDLDSDANITEPIPFDLARLPRLLDGDGDRTVTIIGLLSGANGQYFIAQDDSG